MITQSELVLQKTLKRIIFVTMPSFGYIQNTERDGLLGCGITFARRAGLSIKEIISRSHELVRIVSFGASAFNEAAYVVASQLDSDSWAHPDYPVAAFDRSLGQGSDAYEEMLAFNRETASVRKLFFEYLHPRTNNADVVVVVTGNMVARELSSLLADFLNIPSIRQSSLSDKRTMQYFHFSIPKRDMATVLYANDC